MLNTMLIFLVIVATVSARSSVVSDNFSGNDCVLVDWVGKYYSYAESCDDVVVGCVNDGDSSEFVSCTPLAGGGSDPHFRSFGGELFSYHGECDLVLVRSETAFGVGLDIHIRTEIRETYSFIKGIAIKVGNDTREILANEIYNGTLAGWPVIEVETANWCGENCANAVIHRVIFGALGTMEIANWAGFLHIELNIENVNDFTGLLGEKDSSGFIARDGTTISDVNSHGQEWQVSGTDPQLFSANPNPNFNVPCTLPTTDRRRVDATTRRMARDVCSHLSGELQKMCEFDVQATGDKRMAFSPLFG